VRQLTQGRRIVHEREPSHGALPRDALELLRAAARQALGDLADGVVIAAVPGEGSLRVRPLLVEHQTPEGAAHAREFVVDESGESPLIGEVIACRQTRIVNGLTRAGAAGVVAPESRGFFTKVAVGSLMIVPVFADERLVGTLGCWREGASRPFEYSDQCAGERLAQLIGPAMVLARPMTEGPRPPPDQSEAPAPPSLERLFEATNALISTTNAEGFFTRLNPAWEHTLGWSREALMAQPFTAFVHPDDVARASAELSKTGTPGAEVVSFENRYRCENGSYRWLSWQGITDGSDWYSIAQDVTEQKVATAALERSARELTATQEIGRIGSWEWNLETGKVDWSEQLYVILGVRRQTRPTYETYLELVEPGDRETLEAALRDALAENGEFHYEVPIRRADGNARVETRGQVLRRPDGHPLALRGTAQDVTDARRRERAHAAVIESALDCIVTTDHDGRVTEFNPAAEEVFGYAREEALGREVAELIVPSRLRAAHRLGLARAAGGEAKVLLSRVELVACRQDGSELPVEVTIARTDDVPPKFIAFIRDLSQQRGAVRAARESDERYRQVVETAGQGIWTVDLPPVRARVPVRPRRLRHRLRELHVSEAAGGRLPQDRHRVRSRADDRSGQPARGARGREPRSGLRDQDGGRRRGGRGDPRAAA